MWAQLIDFRLKAGRDEALEETLGILADGEQPGSGLVRQSVLRDQLDPARVVIVVMFDDFFFHVHWIGLWFTGHRFQTRGKKIYSTGNKIPARAVWT